MNVAGAFLFDAPRAVVWQVLTDPQSLAAAMPGCKALSKTSDDHYDLTIEAGVGSVKGTYTGTIALSDVVPTERYQLTLDAKGAAGIVHATSTISLVDADDATTTVQYDGDATVGGLVAGVGQRLIGGVAKMMIDRFFKSMSAQAQKVSASDA